MSLELENTLDHQDFPDVKRPVFKKRALPLEEEKQMNKDVDEILSWSKDCPTCD